LQGEHCLFQANFTGRGVSQTSDVSKTSDVFWQGEHCLFQANFTEQEISQTSDVWQTSDVYP
jgi:hypothetical protein